MTELPDAVRLAAAFQLSQWRFRAYAAMNMCFPAGPA